MKSKALDILIDFANQLTSKRNIKFFEKYEAILEKMEENEKGLIDYEEDLK